MILLFSVFKINNFMSTLLPNLIHLRKQKKEQLIKAKLKLAFIINLNLKRNKVLLNYPLNMTTMELYCLSFYPI